MEKEERVNLKQYVEVKGRTSGAESLQELADAIKEANEVAEEIWDELIEKIE